MTDETAAEWARRTRAEQGLPEKVTDEATLEKIAAIIVSAQREKDRSEPT